MKTCKHCGVSFARPDSIEIPNDLCTLCHDRMGAMERYVAISGRGISPLAIPAGIIWLVAALSWALIY